MTAQPLFDVMRAMYAEFVSHPENKVEANEAAALRGVLKQISAEYEAVVEARNNLVHGTWYIGWALLDADKEFSVVKRKATTKGLARAKTPSTIAELNALTERCKELRFSVALLSGNFQLFDPPRITQVFQRQKGKWAPTIPRPRSF